MKPTEMYRDFVVFIGLGVLIGALWTHFYIKPHDEFSSLVSNCMHRKADLGMQSYQDCVDETRPAR